jgi:hypothetical protein
MLLSYYRDSFYRDKTLYINCLLGLAKLQRNPFHRDKTFHINCFVTCLLGLAKLQLGRALARNAALGLDLQQARDQIRLLSDLPGLVLCR